MNLKNLFKGALVALGLLMAPQVAEATCSGSGVTWACTSGSTSAQIQSAINSASDQATVTLANGTYSFSVSLDFKNGITLACASVRGCTNTSNGDVVTIDFCNGADITNLTRVTGIIFTGASNTGTIWFYCSDNHNITKVRIDNNTFSNTASPGGEIQNVFFGETSKDSSMYGVVDHNIFTATGVNNMAMKNVGGGSTNPNRALRGTANNMFFEDNTITYTSNSNIGLSAFDGYDYNGTVLRFNTVQGSRFEQHSLCHPGMVNFEVYGNFIQNDATIIPPQGGADNYRDLHSQGSMEWTAFNNTFGKLNVGNGGESFALQHYRSDASQLPQGNCAAVEVCNGSFVSGSGIPQTDGNRTGQFGYPCWHQPGRNDSGVLKPLYLWGNKLQASQGGAQVSISISSGGTFPATCGNTDAARINCHIQMNRDIYQSINATAQTSSSSPFNGTVGVGVGTLARRPSTCTATPQAQDAGNGGVAYWATDVGAWNRKTPGTPSGQLYRCSATNTWVLDYVPYAYPHPLIAGDGTPASPTNPRSDLFLMLAMVFAPIGFIAKKLN